MRKGFGILLIAVLTGLFPVRASAQSRPNILVIMTDDQDFQSLLPTTTRPDGTPIMPNVKELLLDRGVNFDPSYVSYPLCCPSRTTFLTGQYAHNHGVIDNRWRRDKDQPPNHGGFIALEPTEDNTLPVWLQKAGYYTAFIGKYVNEYGQRRPDHSPTCGHVAPGWDSWQVDIAPLTYNYYDFAMNINGKVVAYGSPDDPPFEVDRPVTLKRLGCPVYEQNEEKYQTDLHTEMAQEIIRRRQDTEEPFFMWISYLAPHASRRRPNDDPVPARRHQKIFQKLKLPLPPSFNEEDVSDKPEMIRDLPTIPENKINRIRSRYRRRYETLVAVDEGVGNIIQTLKETGQYENTVIIYTSDNGWLQGEHRVIRGKNLLYEESVRVPLVMAGPGIPQGVTVNALTVNTDLAPTIVDLAGATPGRVLDGKSLMPLARDPSLPWRSAVLLECQNFRGHIQMKGVRTRDYLFARRYGWIDSTVIRSEELYDMRPEADPYQLENLHDEELAAKLRPVLAALKDCSGTSGQNSCWV